MINFPLKNKAYLAILVAALGYFVDVYDLVLFSVVRADSLKSLGLAGDELLSNGVYLLNMQMIGMLVGGVLWGILGDKRGRIQVLFGSILLYSIANIANAFVTSVEQYALLRFIAGVGLAGEIGAGITLVSELMPKETRGYGTTIVATIGVSGAVAAGLVGDIFNWRTAYVIGGVMGLCLLLLRVSVAESGLFDATRQQQDVAKGDLKLLFGSRERFLRYLTCILIGVPIWFVVGVIVTFCPEIGVSLNIQGDLKAATAVLCYSIGITVGDLVSGIMSQVMRSRKRVVAGFLGMTFILSTLILNLHGGTPAMFYGTLVPLGFFIGYWALFISIAAEQFGTNLRATVTTTVPNFVRGTVVIMTLLFNTLKDDLGVLGSAQVVGLLACSLAFLSLWKMKETFACDLNFIESKDGRQLYLKDSIEITVEKTSQVEYREGR